MKRRKCSYCKMLNEEEYDLSIDTVVTTPTKYFHWYCPIKYCPACGTTLKRYKNSMEGLTNEKLT